MNIAMKTKNLRTSVLAICLLLSFLGAFSQTGQQILHGRMVCGADSVDFAYLQNMRTNQAVETNNGGWFSMTVQPNDTIRFRCLGYRDTLFVVTPANCDVAAFKVEREQFALNEVEVRWFYSYASFRQAFLNLKLDDKDKPMRFHVSIDYAQMAIDSRFAPGAAGFGFDLTQLASKGGKLLAGQNAMAELQKRSAVYERYDKLISHENIADFTKLQGDALESFMVYLRTKAKIDPTWSDYQIMASVKLSFDSFNNGYSPDSTLMRK
jgi:hypothetical protein